MHQCASSFDVPREPSASRYSTIYSPVFSREDAEISAPPAVNMRSEADSESHAARPLASTYTCTLSGES